MINIIKFTHRNKLRLSVFLLLVLSNIFFGQGEEVFKKVNASVVVIHTINSDNKVIATGSGVVIKEKGYVVTNCHVLGDISNDLIVTHYGKQYKSKSIIYIDPISDILIFSINDNDLPEIIYGNTKDLSEGQKVYAIGSPFGLENTITEGVVSGFRDFGDSRYIQISTPISPGNSGGAVVNEDGELIGISTFTYQTGQNINFAIPIEKILIHKESSPLNFNSKCGSDVRKKVVEIMILSHNINENKDEVARKINTKIYSLIDSLIQIKEKKPFWQVYTGIGFGLYEVKDYKNAINYLIVAKKMGEEYSFDDLILAISFESLGDNINAEYYYKIAAEEGQQRAIDWLENNTKTK